MNDSDAEIIRVMECMPYGLYIIGSTGASGPNGMMGDWITQVSFRPRLISVAIENDAQTLANIRASGVFTLNFISEGPTGMNLARQFAAPYNASKIGGPTALGVRPKLLASLYRSSALGAPILHASIAWLDCAAKQFVPVGDHTLVIGQVMDGRMQAEGPLSLPATPAGLTAANRARTELHRVKSHSRVIPSFVLPERRQKPDQSAEQQRTVKNFQSQGDEL